MLHCVRRYRGYVCPLYLYGQGKHWGFDTGYKCVGKDNHYVNFEALTRLAYMTEIGYEFIGQKDDIKY